MLKLQVNPKKYLKSQARSLPVTQCLINEEWQKAGVAHIIIGRQHKTGNLTAGVFIVDIHCLGLYETYEFFNLSPNEFSGLVPEPADWIDCDYTLAHNIIYGGIGFAEDYGFKPHKNFGITQYLLEEDDDHVELMELDFGLNGSPCYMPAPDDDPIKVKNTIATLERTAGIGNFIFIDPSELDFEDYLDDDEEYGEFDEDLDDDDDPILDAVRELYFEINQAYDARFRTTADVNRLIEYPLAEAYEITWEMATTEYNKFDDEAQEMKFVELHQMVIRDGNAERAIPLLKVAIAQWPHKPLFYNLLQSAYVKEGRNTESTNIVRQLFKLFPGYLFARISFANMLIDSGDLEKVAQLLDNKSDLHEVYPDRNVFHFTEVASYFATLCRYHTATGNIDLADCYMQAIFECELTGLAGQTVVNKAMAELVDAKMKLLDRALEG